jgi:hypothetical protein
MLDFIPTPVLTMSSTDTNPLPPFDLPLIDDRPLTKEFFRAARQHGVNLLELCAGISSTLEMLLRAGIRVNNYYYVDNNPKARLVARFRLGNLTATYPHLFPPSSWENSFDLPQDLNQVTALHLHEILPVGPAQ